MHQTQYGISYVLELKPVGDTFDVQVCLYAFDCLHLNGETLIQKPLTERREALYSAISEAPGELQLASTKVHLLPSPAPHIWYLHLKVATRCLQDATDLYCGFCYNLLYARRPSSAAEIQQGA